MVEKERKEQKSNDEMEVRWRSDIGSHRMPSILSEQTRWGNSGIHLKPTSMCSEAGKERYFW